MAVAHNMLIVGSYINKLFCMRLDQPAVNFCRADEDRTWWSVTAIEIFKRDSGAIHFIAADFRGRIKHMDTETFGLERHFALPWSVKESKSTNRRTQQINGST